MKVKLLNDGGYNSMKTVPVGKTFEAEIEVGVFASLATISRKDLLEAGADGDYFTTDSLSFFIGTEAEIVEEE